MGSNSTVAEDRFSSGTCVEGGGPGVAWFLRPNSLSYQEIA